MEFTRHAHTLLVNLGYPNTPTTLEVWADWLLDFHTCYLQGNFLKIMQGTLEIDANLQNKLCVLVKKIHTSPNLCLFKDPLDSSCSFHVQHKEPVRIQSKALPPILYQQEELNIASSVLRNLNPTGGLFDQSTAHTLALFACPQANSILSAFYTWNQPAIPESHAQWPPSHIDNDN
ncbi:hypothetical protein C0989_004892 [Termitomyces sp. Mn162]|nr:hypothetical protein C0989_004892 [Termitomyces sp. Mn162]